MTNKDKILSTVSSFYKVDIYQRTNKREIAFARMVAITMLHVFTKMTLSDISKEFGKEDHSRVIFAKKRVWGLCRFDSAIRNQVIQIETQIENAGE